MVRFQTGFVKYDAVQRSAVDGSAIDTDLIVRDPKVRSIVVAVEIKSWSMPEHDCFAAAVLLFVERFADPEEVLFGAVVPIFLPPNLHRHGRTRIVPIHSTKEAQPKKRADPCSNVSSSGRFQ